MTSGNEDKHKSHDTTMTHSTILHLDSELDFRLEALAHTLQLSKTEAIDYILRLATDEACVCILRDRRRSPSKRQGNRVEIVNCSSTLDCHGQDEPITADTIHGSPTGLEKDLGSASHTEDVNIELSLPCKLVERIDTAIKRLGIRNRQHYLLKAVEWSLCSLE